MPNIIQSTQKQLAQGLQILHDGSRIK